MVENEMYLRPYIYRCYVPNTRASVLEGIPLTPLTQLRIIAHKKSQGISNMNGDWSMFARTLVTVGVILVVLGLILVFLPKIPFLGRLPGDICIKKEGFVFYFPVTTSILISLILTLLFYIFRR